MNCDFLDNNHINYRLIVGNNIANERRKINMSQAKLAELADISISHISNIENGKAEMGISIFCKIAEGLGVSSDILLKGAISNSVINNKLKNTESVNPIFNNESERSDSVSGIGLRNDYVVNNIKDIIDTHKSNPYDSTAKVLAYLSELVKGY